MSRHVLRGTSYKVLKISPECKAFFCWARKRNLLYIVETRDRDHRLVATYKIFRSAKYVSQKHTKIMKYVQNLQKAVETSMVFLFILEGVRDGH